MKTESVTFISRAGHSLAGLIDRPDTSDNRVWAIFAHCFTCGKDLKPFHHLSRGLTDGGIGVLRFDFTGLGESGGEFPDSNLTTGAGDIVDAGRFLAQNFGEPGILIGHSFGGTSAIKAAAELDSVKAVVTIAAAADPDHLGSTLALAREESARSGSARVTIGGQSFTLRHQFFEDLATHAMRDDLAGLDKALLVLHAPDDEAVGIDNASRLFKAAPHPKSFVALNGGGHLMLDRGIAYYAGSIIAAWAQPYVSNGEEHT